jgi:hypothetical protein
MHQKLPAIAFAFWLAALMVWQVIFNSHAVVSEILWEIHTIFSSVILFYLLLNRFVSAHVLDLIKFVFRIVFKVWLIIFLAFSMHNSFDQKAFVLTASFIFGYLEGLIDVSSWLKNTTLDVPLLEKIKSRTDKMLASIIIISLIHIFCAFIALIFFNID